MAAPVEMPAQGYRWYMAVAASRRTWRQWRVGRVGAALAAGVAVVLAVGCTSTDPEDAETSFEASVDDGATSPVTPDEAEPAVPEQLVTTEPDRYSEVGDLVEGFPIELLPVPADAVILVTSAVPVGDADVQEVSLNLRTSASATDLLELYRDALTTVGFAEVTSQTSDSDLAVDVTFVRSGGDELVSIGVLDVDGARTVTIGARLRTD